MTCEKCSGLMFIDSWEGWVWVCPICGHVGRAATNNEIREMEGE
jgi:hypothetical protein